MPSDADPTRCADSRSRPDEPAPPADRVRDLVLRAQARDRDAFATLYTLRFRDVARYVTAILGRVDQAEDVVAQTFLLAWKNLPTLRRPERFDAWLFRIAHHQAINEFRRPRHQAIEDVAEPADPSPLSTPHD